MFERANSHDGAARRGYAPLVATQTRPPYPIESVERALALLMAFEDTEVITIREAGELLAVSRSTAYRLLSLLEHFDFVRQDPQTKAYHRGPALLRIALAALDRSDIRGRLRPLLERVVSELDETCHLVVLQDTQALFLDCVESSRTIRATPRTGTSLPAHCTAAGKVLLAGLPLPQLDALLAKELPSLTRRSKTSPASVRRAVGEVRKRGWATNIGESEDGLHAVAVTVPRTATGSGVDAAITVAGPTQRLDAERLEALAPRLQQLVGDFAGGPVAHVPPARRRLP
jgi:DNA-binding IclR family transcriptional regulator